MEVVPTPLGLNLHYSHDELGQELLCYCLSDSGISKSYVPVPSPNSVWFPSQHSPECRSKFTLP